MYFDHIEIQLSFGAVTYVNGVYFSTVTISVVPTGEYTFSNAFVRVLLECSGGWSNTAYYPYIGEKIHLDPNGYGEITRVIKSNKATLPQDHVTFNENKVGYSGTVR